MRPIHSNVRPAGRHGLSLIGLAVLAPLAAAVLVACGGGPKTNNTPPAGLTGTSSVSRGTLTGFGSIYVNGIEYDDSTATIQDDEGNVQPASALKLGMQVELSGQDAAAGADMGSASTVVFGSDLVGPVSASDSAAQTITILGQTISVNSLTAIDSALPGGIAGLTPGEVLKVYAMYDATTGRYEASRIEFDADATSYKLRGLIANLDTTAKTYTVGSTVVDYSAVTTLPAGLANGALVVATLNTTAGANGWAASALRIRDGGLPAEHVVIHVRGLIATETSPLSFTLDGWPVDASAATFPSGQAAILAGASVQVDGIMSKGVLVASNVDVQQPGGHGGLDFEVHGPIDTVDTAAQTISIRGQTISYAGAVTYSGGDATSLVVGGRALVQGTLSADGTSVQAVNIAFGK